MPFGFQKLTSPRVPSGRSQPTSFCPQYIIQASPVRPKCRNNVFCYRFIPYESVEVTIPEHQSEAISLNFTLKRQARSVDEGKSAPSAEKLYTTSPENKLFGGGVAFVISVVVFLLLHYEYTNRIITFIFHVISLLLVLFFFSLCKIKVNLFCFDSFYTGLKFLVRHLCSGILKFFIKLYELYHYFFTGADEELYAPQPQYIRLRFLNRNGYVNDHYYNHRYM